MKETFETIYRDEVWGGGSGEGSLAIHNGPYIATLQEFMRDKDIRAVVDLGCGDWQFSQHVDWSGTEYHGFDLADSVIDHNKKTYSGEKVHFHRFDGDLEQLPEADLLLAKDVLQHWSNASVDRFLPYLNRYRYALITNCINPRGPTKNRDIEDGGFRRLDLRNPPFNLDATELLRFTNKKPRLFRFLQRTRWRKAVLLVTRQ